MSLCGRIQWGRILAWSLVGGKAPACAVPTDPKATLQNEAECKTVIDIAKILHLEGKDFRIITPYDAQRAMVEQRLKKTVVPWQDRVFNVDSFQGSVAERAAVISIERAPRK